MIDEDAAPFLPGFEENIKQAAASLPGQLHAPLQARNVPSDPALARVRAIVEATPGQYMEPCKKCNGTGGFYSKYSGRRVGECFACKGKGHNTFKTAPEARAKQAVAREKSRDQKYADFGVKYPEQFAWIEAKRGTLEFAGSMVAAIQQYGDLTEGQMAGVDSAITKGKQWAIEAAQRHTVAAQRVETAPVISIAKVKESLDRAFSRGLKKPKLLLGDFKFTRAPDLGKNPGAVYVTKPVSQSGREDTYLGKAVTDGKFIASRDATAEQVAEILEVAADPEGSAAAFGRMTGNCACCGKKLTADESILRTIGPVCWKKYFS